MHLPMINFKECDSYACRLGIVGDLIPGDDFADIADDIFFYYMGWKAAPVF